MPTDRKTSSELLETLETLEKRRGSAVRINTAALIAKMFSGLIRFSENERSKAVSVTEHDLRDTLLHFRSVCDHRSCK